MVVRQETRTGSGAAAQPAEFRDAVARLNAARLRPEVNAEAMPAPQRIAPYATALTADVEVDGEEVGTGRIILLHDPAGNDVWEGRYRLVAYVRTETDPEQATDPLLGEVGWSWLLEALAEHGAEHVAASGSVTRVSTETFGTMSEDPGSAQVEIRASWTPLPGPDGVPDLTAHVEAWGELLCVAAGLPPVPQGVAIMPSRRGQRGAG